jgi:single-strand DNA-binding protein
MYNHITLMGRICNDLDLKSTPNGLSVLTFRIAADRSFADKSGDRRTDFFDIVAWRQTAEFIAKYFSKGKMILLDGEMQTREYTDKTGVDRKVYEVIVNTARFTGDRRDAGPKPPSAGFTAEKLPQQTAVQPQNPYYSNDDTPFG